MLLPVDRLALLKYSNTVLTHRAPSSQLVLSLRGSAMRLNILALIHLIVLSRLAVRRELATPTTAL